MAQRTRSAPTLAAAASQALALANKTGVHNQWRLLTSAATVQQRERNGLAGFRSANDRKGQQYSCAIYLDGTQVPRINLAFSRDLTYKDEIYALQKDWWMASDGAACGACEFLVPALAKRTNAFIDGFAKMLRDDNHYAATLFIRPALEHILIAISSDEYEGGHHEFAQRIMDGTQTKDLKSTSGRRMYGPYLVKRLQARLDPVRPDLSVVDLYDWSNTFVHFGSQMAYSLVDDVAEPGDSDGGRISFALRGPTYKIPSAAQKNVADWIHCMVGIATMMESCLEGMIAVRQNWLCQIDGAEP